jgi:hypothetical protein
VVLESLLEGNSYKNFAMVIHLRGGACMCHNQTEKALQPLQQQSGFLVFMKEAGIVQRMQH